MSTEVLPVGVQCNLGCHYCYEGDLREVTKGQERYNREAVLKAIDTLENPWSLFGGEPLILNKKDLEELLMLSHKRWGKSQIQTNGSLITDDHIELFRKYKTWVGISLDGPDELNDSRWAGTLEATRKQTARTGAAIAKLAEASKKDSFLLPSLIVTCHAGNCSPERFPRFMDWFRELDAMGIRSVNLHVMERDHNSDPLYLPQRDVAMRLVDLWNLQEEFTNLRFTKFDEVLSLLQGDDENDVSCVWHACDPLNTAAVTSIDYDGAPSVCKRTFKGAKRWLPAEGTGYNATFIKHPGTRHRTRQLALYVTPQEYGGCKDCPFWVMCLGQCPGEGEGQDWRVRSHYCETWKILFAEGARRLRAIGKKPVCDMKDLKHIETLMYDMWVSHQHPSLKSLIKQHKECTAKGMKPVKGGYHGDSGKQ